ncbi:MAG: helix-turn-helix domain-containing protein [Cyanobacteriota bacterium]
MELPIHPASGLKHPLQHQLKISKDPDVCASNLAKVLPLHHLDPLTPANEWWHHNGELPLPQLPIAACIGSPFLLECSNHPLHRLVLVHDGHATVQQHDQSHTLDAGDGVILPGKPPWNLLGQHSSITTIGFDPLLLLTAARNMSPTHWAPPSPVDSPLRRLLPLPTRTDGHCAALVGVISLELPAIHQMAQLGDNVLEGFLLLEQLYRIIAALVFPELRHGPSVGDKEVANGDRRLDRLLDYITLHLSDPLPLSVLEAQSHYSRRSLHYAFQERFGCSPMQWIRRQRMRVALQRLQDAHSGETVAAVVAACGYRSQSRFRIDFERAYGWKPSAVLRGAVVVHGSSNTSSLAP